MDSGCMFESHRERVYAPLASKPRHPAPERVGDLKTAEGCFDRDFPDHTALTTGLAEAALSVLLTCTPWAPLQPPNQHMSVKKGGSPVDSEALQDVWWRRSIEVRRGMDTAFQRAKGAAENRFFEWHEPRHWPARFCDHNFLSRGYLLHEGGEVGLGGMNVHNFHDWTKFSLPVKLLWHRVHLS